MTSPRFLIGIVALTAAACAALVVLIGPLSPRKGTVDGAVHVLSGPPVVLIAPANGGSVAAFPAPAPKKSAPRTAPTSTVAEPISTAPLPTTPVTQLSASSSLPTVRGSSTKRARPYGIESCGC
jgi:hypothetical protein